MLSPTILQRLWDHLPDTVLLVDDQGLIQSANPAVSLLGYDPEELQGVPVEELVPEESRQHHVTLRQSYLDGPSPRVMGARFALEAVHKDRSRIPVDIALSPVMVDGCTSVLVVIRDATERREYENQIRRLTFHDPITGLHNRAYFEEQLSRLEKSRHQSIAVVMIDLDGLKKINDQQGHHAGDWVLQQTGQLLSECVRHEDVLCRIGGDEFALLVPAIRELTLNDLVHRLESHVEGHVALSIGGALAPSGADLRDALRQADSKMYERKRASGHHRNHTTAE